jgi:hypothetical protein
MWAPAQEEEGLRRAPPPTASRVTVSEAHHCQREVAIGAMVTVADLARSAIKATGIKVLQTWA